MVGLTRTQLIATLFVLTLVFVFVNGPVWRNPFELDVAVWWSYLPIPLVVLLLLAYNRRRGRAFSFGVALAIDTLILVFAKFGVTYTIATVAWAISPPPPPPLRASPAAQPAIA